MGPKRKRKEVEDEIQTQNQQVNESGWEKLEAVDPVGPEAGDF